MSLSVTLRHRLSGLDLDVAFDARSGITVLFGPSGAGKTTVVNAVAGLLKADFARIALDGNDLTDTTKRFELPPSKRRIGYIFQEARLFPHLTVRQNLLYGAWIQGFGRKGTKFDDLVELLGLGQLLRRYPRHLSGGETQRVAIGRALLAEPRMILADEPLAGLDEERKAEILPYFERLRDEVNVPFLYVSHSANEVARLATEVVVINKGHVQRQGTAADVLGDPEVAPFGTNAAGALIEAVVTRHTEDGLTELNAQRTAFFVPRISAQVGAPMRLRVAARDVILTLSRPEDASALNILPARVLHIRNGADHSALLSLDTDAGRLLATLTQRSVHRLDLEPGRVCFALIKTVAIAPDSVGDVRPGT